MITIEVTNREVLETLNRIAHGITDMTPVMVAIGQALEGRIKDRFETETDPTGTAWAPWADSYDPAKGGTRPTNGNTTILDLYGDMLGSLNWEADANSTTVGFGKDYAAYHEYGTKRMPRRGMLFANPESGALGQDDEDSILELLDDYLNGLISA